jgi:hypothetical protein
MGPVLAVIITLVWERHRRAREQQLLLLQTLLATRGRYADPSFSWAIRTIPLHFSGHKAVKSAHSDYMNAVRFEPNDADREKHEAEMGRRLGILISAMLVALDYKGLTAEQVEEYTARGLAMRELWIEQALRALPHIAFSLDKSANAAQKLTDNVLSNVPPPAELAPKNEI